MAQIYPFRALRYDTQKAPLADVVTQPYDKISPAMQDRYYAQSPYNLIRVILGRREPADDEHNNVYTRASEQLAAWRANGVLVPEAVPAIYGYAQTYTVPGTDEVRTRRGFIALGKLHDYADHVVYRHEQTFPKHKSDRLALFKATRTYCEQIYMLYADPAFTAERLIFGVDPLAADAPVASTPADQRVVDEYGVTHELWRVTDAAVIAGVVEAMQGKPLIIADGHHRYETSVGYMHERAAELGLDDRSAADTADGGLPAPAFPEAAMMMTFVNMDAPGITILPTHRVVFGLRHFKGRSFAEQAQTLFDVTDLPLAADGHRATHAELLAHLNAAGGSAFVAVTREGDFLLVPRAEATQPLLANMSARQAALDVTQLHRLVLDQLLGLDEATVRAGTHVRYVREAAEALEQVECGNADVAFLIRPVTLEQMKEISLALEVMPQKSTDFYPKLLSGLAMYPLD